MPLMDRPGTLDIACKASRHVVGEESGWSQQPARSSKSFLGRAADELALLLDKANTDYLAGEIGRRIFRFMMKPEEAFEVGPSLPQIGMDSLMAIELQRWWKKALVWISVCWRSRGLVYWSSWARSR
ncbi:hypothetical protein IFM47457_07185 [Aspergillus lentulus]|nr:hypothetical protein IFM47457_07185 [Aspergillus lentulus]